MFIFIHVFLNCIINIFFSNSFGVFFYYMQCECCACAVGMWVDTAGPYWSWDYLTGLWDQLPVTWSGCNQSDLLLVSGLTYPLSLCRTHPGLGPVAEKSPSWPKWNSNSWPPGVVPAAPTTRLRRPVKKCVVHDFPFINPCCFVLINGSTTWYLHNFKYLST